MKDPPIFLYEATSSLDTITEQVEIPYKPYDLVSFFLQVEKSSVWLSLELS